MTGDLNLCKHLFGSYYAPLNHQQEMFFERLAEIRNNPEELAKYNTPANIWREVKASQRLAGINVEELRDSNYVPE